MLGHQKARWLLAPLLAAAISTGQEVKGPHALINLDINSTSDEINHHETILRLDILESKSPCGYGNVTLNGQLLAQDENGAGSGPVISENGITILANWSFSCVHLEDEFQGQLMTFDVISVDEEEVHDVSFSVQFQQMAPPSISSINGTVSITEAHIPTPVTKENLSKETSTLDDELSELKSMMRQLAALEQAIDSKVQYISETYDVNSHEELHSVWRCDSLKCVVKTMYGRAKHMASRLYGYGSEGNGHFGSRPHRQGWRFHHGHPPDWFPHDVAHWNHSHPHPRPRPPHYQPPHDPPHGPPHHEPPHFHPPPPFCHCAPPPPPHESYGEQPPRFHPPPSHQILEDGMDQENFALGTGPNDGMRPTRKPGGDKAEASPHTVGDGSAIPPPMSDHHHRPPPPGFRSHGVMPPHPHHNPHFEHRGPPHPLPLILIVVTIVSLSLLISAICMRCCTASCRNRHNKCTERRQSRETRRHCRRNTWAKRRAAIGTRYAEIVGWLKETIRRQEVEDEEREKDALMRQLHRSESEEDDNISTTMEQEIAQFRAVASVVGDLVAAEEGRSREYVDERQYHRTPTPLSPTSAFPEYASIDEELPAYDEGSNDSRFVADGFRYTPGFPYYTPTDTSTVQSSLDEHLGRKD